MATWIGRKNGAAIVDVAEGGRAAILLLEGSDALFRGRLAASAGAFLRNQDPDLVFAKADSVVREGDEIPVDRGDAEGIRRLVEMLLADGADPIGGRMCVAVAAARLGPQALEAVLAAAKDSDLMELYTPAVAEMSRIEGALPALLAKMDWPPPEAVVSAAAMCAMWGSREDAAALLARESLPDAVRRDASRMLSEDRDLAMSEARRLMVLG